MSKARNTIPGAMVASRATRRSRVIVFADDAGLPQLREALPGFRPVAIVGASIRPHQHAALLRHAAELEARFLVQPRQDDESYAAFRDALVNLRPDLFVVNSYAMMLRPDLLDIPPAGGVNVHAGRLPEFRGANPIQWALIEDCREAGVTMHRLTEHADAGAIIDERVVTVRFEDTWKDVLERAQDATLLLLRESLTLVLNGEETSRQQDEARAVNRGRRRPEDGLLDLGNTALSLYNTIRALVAPLPGATYEVGGRTEHVREWLPIADVARIKFPAGVPALGGLQILPAVRDGSRVERNRLVEFGDRSAVVVAQVRADWDRRTGIVVPSAGLKESEVRTLITFCRAEFGLRSSAEGFDRVPSSR